MANDKTQKLQSTSAIAKLFGISSRRVQQLTQDGVIFQNDGKGYDLEVTVQKYIKHLQEKATGKEEKNQIVGLEKERLDAEISLKKSKARVAELELEELEGKMHRSEDVESMTTDLVLNIRSMMLTLPGLLATEVSEINDAAETSEVIKRAVHDILEALSDYKYDPVEYKRRVRERQGWNHEHEDEE
jgi:phage terminase Nu1 subunit (DNA packaging protein)